MTSRLLPAAALPNIPNLSEALLMIDEPGAPIASVVPGFGLEAPQNLCPTPATGCTEFASIIGGVTVATDAPGGTTPGRNVFQGIVNPDGIHPNLVTFFGVPVLAPGGLSRTFRITNVRVNASIFGGGAGFAQIIAQIGVSNPAAMPITNSVPVVGLVQSGLSTSVSPVTNLSQCQSAANVPVSTLTFGERFATAFNTRVFAQSDILYDGQGITLNQNVPGAFINSESNFVLPTGGTQTAGLSDFGTRLLAAFNNVPAGVRLFVSVGNVTSSLTPVTPPAIPGGNAANANGQPYA